MTHEHTTWPAKTRDLHNHHLDSTPWDHVELREGDVVIASWPKSGSTWTQQLVGQLLHAGSAELDITKQSLWIDLRVPPLPVKQEILGSMPGRRFVKTHLPVDALVYSEDRQVRVRGPRRARRGLEPVQPPRPRQRAVVRDPQRHAGAGRRAHAAPAGVRRRVLRHLARARRLPAVVVLGAGPQLVGHPLLAQPALHPLRRAAQRLRRGGAAPRRVPGCGRGQPRLGGGRAALLFRLHEGQRWQGRAPGRRILGGRPADLHPQGHQRPLARPAERRAGRPLRGDGHRAPR
ncbi:Sulfotransferase [Plesiocystis pacifica SIR-1]|uniref:Sulfotransferase n=1 Tax=Plesiocystis pacifica SIR-1 TaxID=391625 RepID=A6FZW1_9BACT|nr:Sulfotransferase [Plesiocystis pacifica SIR-1]